jgi:hypothetical protein
VHHRHVAPSYAGWQHSPPSPATASPIPPARLTCGDGRRTSKHSHISRSMCSEWRWSARCCCLNSRRTLDTARACTWWRYAASSCTLRLSALACCWWCGSGVVVDGRDCVAGVVWVGTHTANHSKRTDAGRPRRGQQRSMADQQAKEWTATAKRTRVRARQASE